jgi:NADPH:quinone reductase-like Zn-dependent oxidoreductase
MATMRAWQFTPDSEGTVVLPSADVPRPQIRDDQILIEVYSAGLNPHDLKVAEGATPGMDFCGKVAEIGQKIDTIKVGEMVFGANVEESGHGSLAEYTVVTKEVITSMPDGVAIDDLAGFSCQALTAYEAIQPFVKSGDKVFVNGGSGGTGQMCIQIAKALGCHVITTVSPGNNDYTKSLGADEIINYRSFDPIAVLRETNSTFHLIVDNVGHPTLEKLSVEFLEPNGHFSRIGAIFRAPSVPEKEDPTLMQGFLSGGTKRCWEFMKKNPEALARIGSWMQEKKLQPLVDSTFEFDAAPEAWERLKSRFQKGRVVLVHVKKQ